MNNVKPAKSILSFNSKLKRSPLSESEVDRFIALINTLKDDLGSGTEGNNEGKIKDFLQNAFYNKHSVERNPNKTRIDLAILTNNHVEVLIETKSLNNKTEMLTKDDLNKKALQEAILYYCQQRYDYGNNQLKRVIITNGYEWFIFDAIVFEQCFYNNKVKQEYKKFKEGKLASRNTEHFYKEVIPKYIVEAQNNISFLYFDISKLAFSKDNLQKVSDIYKIFSPDFLLKSFSAEDPNSLNKGFYRELLYIMGLEEKKQQGKIIIRRAKITGSIIENTIEQIEHKLSYIPNLQEYGKTKDEQLFSIALELCLTWVNRLLFLKLLESQIVSFHQADQKAEYEFLNPHSTNNKVKEFDDLNALFFFVLSKKFASRKSRYQQRYKHVPYLNSSLFEMTKLEADTVQISNLTEEEEIIYFPQSVLRDKDYKNTPVKLLDYLLKFLHAYDFATEGNDALIKKENSSVINAAILGKVFEKINGYQDGSFYTPAYITEYMCKQTITKRAIDKFNKTKGWNCQTLDDVYNKIDNLEEANQIINSLTICDPSVGSGHFLVSALNQLIALKSELGILCYDDGKKIKDYTVSVDSDELLITDDEGAVYKYKPTSKSANKLQKAIFSEKQAIIENCLFGVDINSKSVEICKLRLWIELLKHTYYLDYQANAEHNELQTLPNIDINIKCGNSLIHKIPLDKSITSVKEEYKHIDFDHYRQLISEYIHVRDKDKKHQINAQITEIKQNLTRIARDALFTFVEDEASKQLAKQRKELLKQRKQAKTIKQIEKIDHKLAKLSNNLDGVKGFGEHLDDPIYDNSLEWRIEFPQVLNNNGDFLGFDIVVGNPPYIQLQSDSGKLGNLYQDLKFDTFTKTGDIYALFYEKGYELLTDKGLLYFITSNKWMRAGYGEKLRGFLANKTNPNELIDLGSGVFEEATVDSNILMLEKSSNQQALKALALTEKTEELEEPFIEQSVNLTNLSSDVWFIASEAEISLKQKIEKIGKPLKDWQVSINYGIKTGYNDAFIIDTATKEELISQDANSADIIKPLLRGRDIKRYSYNWQGLWLIATFPSLKIDIEKYPAIKQHLLKFGQDRLEQSGKNLTDGRKARKKTSNKWFETQDQIGYHEEFAKEKIIYPNMTQFLPFMYDDNEHFINDKGFIITGEKIVFLLGIFNSRLAHNWIRNNCPQLSAGTEVRKIFFQNLPISPITANNQHIAKQIEVLATKITNSKKLDITSDTTNLEHDIDKLVYQLYELSEEEIAVIEKNK